MLYLELERCKMKTIIVNEKFKLPKVSIEVFKKLAQVLEYERGYGNWTVRSGSEYEAFELLSKYFNGFDIIKKCKEKDNSTVSGICEFKINVGLEWSLFAQSQWESHLDAHLAQKYIESKVFADMTGYLRKVENESDNRWRWRQCAYCNTNMKGQKWQDGSPAFTFLGALMWCKYCEHERIYNIFSAQLENDSWVESKVQMEEMDNLKGRVMMRIMNTRLKKVAVILVGTEGNRKPEP